MGLTKTFVLKALCESVRVIFLSSFAAASLHFYIIYARAAGAKVITEEVAAGRVSFLFFIAYGLMLSKPLRLIAACRPWSGTTVALIALPPALYGCLYFVPALYIGALLMVLAWAIVYQAIVITHRIVNR